MFKAMRLMLRPAFSVQEPLLIREGAQLRWPATFIIGAPRSGTTLMAQLAAGWFHTSYICNFAETCPAWPAASTLLVRREIRKYRPDFTNSYGYTKGRPGPNEGRTIWQRWYGMGWKDESMVAPELQRRAYATVAAIERIVGAPFISKNPRHSVRMRVLDATFPGCLFVWVRRGPVRVAESLLAARRTNRAKPVNGPREEEWWGVRPRAFPYIRTHHYIDQVCEQVYYTEQDILDGIECVGAGRCIHVSYEDLCEEPGREMRRVQRFLVEGGVDIEIKEAVSPELKVSQNRPATEEELRMIRQKCQALYNGRTPLSRAGPAIRHFQ